MRTNILALPVTECVSYRVCRDACPPRVVRITRELTLAAISMAAVYADACHIDDGVTGLKHAAGSSDEE